MSRMGPAKSLTLNYAARKQTFGGRQLIARSAK